MKYVFIHSNRTINVTTGLQFVNKTNNNLRVENNYKIKPVWPTMIVRLLEGRHLYPAIVANFKSVESLKKAKIISIAEYVDEIPADEDVARIKEIEKRLRPLINEMENEKAKKEEKKTNKKKDTNIEKVESEE